MNEWTQSFTVTTFFSFWKKKKNYFICLVKYIPFYALPLNVQFFNFNYLHFCFHLSRPIYALFGLSINVYFNDLSEWIRKFHTLPVAHVIISLLISNHSTVWLQQNIILSKWHSPISPTRMRTFHVLRASEGQVFLSFPFANANACS